MESKIKWQIGKPKEKGIYLVTYKFGYYSSERYLEKEYRISIDTSYWDNFWYQYDNEMLDCKIIAWCKLSDIEPYKE